MSPATVARVLGHAFHFAPNDTGRAKLTEEIIECKLDPDDVHCSPELLAGLAHLYVYGMMRVFYNPKGPTPLVSPAQNARSSFGDAVRTPSHLLTPTLVTTQTLRQRTLLRDENRCVFTGCLDAHIYQSLPRGEQLAALTTSEGPAVPIALLTQVAHVISQSLPSNIGGMTQAAREKFVWASTAAAVLERFGGFSAYTILGEDNLNSAANAFTASSTPHDMFDCLDLWLLPAQVWYTLAGNIHLCCAFPISITGPRNKRSSHI
ncbi:hypothetical protein BDN70DRAFT_886513 [Pholiota conissans]|uniref:HNH nuclease domain-containing protein n=1 Tax=Pholiota conissans TaxID=109636 RepID=A0A9P6CNG8_9AGAR|nr:hypothetical protein BDN70DRAFT_886513 [Pholiota conissans]